MFLNIIIPLEIMERPRRKPRPPGALSDYLTTEEGEKKSVYVEENLKEEKQEEEEVEEKDINETEADRKLLLSQPYKCKECKARYRSRVALLRHAVKHSGEEIIVYLI